MARGKCHRSPSLTTFRTESVWSQIQPVTLHQNGGRAIFSPALTGGLHPTSLVDSAHALIALWTGQLGCRCGFPHTVPADVPFVMGAVINVLRNCTPA